MPVNSFEDYPMSWKPDLSQTTGPKYIALAKLLEEDVASGKLKAGTKLPPQRELADFLDVNLSTISRAFKLCEQKGLICASVGNGTFVSADVQEEKMLLLNEGNEEIVEMGAIVPASIFNIPVKEHLSMLLSEKNYLSMFSYGMPEGTKGEKSAGVKWLSMSGFITDEEHILQAAGGQNGLLAALGAFFKRGDRVGTDPLTYPGVKTAAEFLGIHLIPIQSQNGEMTEEGIRYAIQNENIKGIYVIPDFQNPTAHIMSIETRKMIAEVAKETGLIVIEDSINNMLANTPSLPMASFAPEHVILVTSLSKTISPGLRVAYLHVPSKYHQNIVKALYSMNIAISPLMSSLAKELIMSGEALEIVKRRRKDNLVRNSIVNRVLKGYVADEETTSPLRWIKLPEYFTGKSFEICAKEAGVQVYGAERFAVGNKLVEKAIRIAITTPATHEQLEEGLNRIRSLLQQEDEILLY